MQNFRTLMMLLGLLLLLQPLSVLLAQETITIDSSTLGELTTVPAQSNYTFTATTNDTINIELISVTASLGLQAVVLDGGGGLVLAIGNPSNASSVQDQLTLVAGTIYTLIVSSSNDQTGEFVLRLTTQAPIADCEVLIDTAIDSIARVCAATGRNQACISNLSVNAIPVARATDFRFATEGDITNIANIDTLQLGPLDEATGELGMVYMLVQANLPDTIPGQNVAMVLYGDVQISNSTATDSELASLYNPMQAFYFTSGIGPSRCANLPDNGILIETPRDAVEVTLSINEVNIQLGSTAFVSFSNNQTLDVALLEGVALVSAEGGAQIVNAGQQVRIPIGDDLLPVAPPAAPEPLPTELERVPTQVAVEPVAATATPPALPTPELTPVSERLPLPLTGPCVLRTFEADNFVNVRSGPSTDFAQVSFIEPDETYAVIGRTADNSWYEIDFPAGWVAGFVTERGGDCDRVPITFTPATPTPAPTIGPLPTATSVLPIAGDNEYNVTVDATRLGTQWELGGAISSPIGDGQDTVRYNIINISRAQGNAFRLSIRCDGVGVEFATIFFADGSTRDCSPTAYNFIDTGFFTPSTSFTIGFLSDPGNAYVTWSAELGISRR